MPEAKLRAALKSSREAEHDKQQAAKAAALAEELG